MTLWVISDTHFGHENILTFKRYDGSPVRSFASVEEMDELMVERWNAVVKPADHVYHLGDVAMKRSQLQIVKRLHGHKRLIFGNHDIFDYKSYIEVGFEKVMGMRVLDGWILTHVPIHPGSLGRFRGNIHGHIHNNGSVMRQEIVQRQGGEFDETIQVPDERYVNVSVEVVNYTPVALEEISRRRP